MGARTVRARIAVVGSGIAGLGAARALARAGHAPTLFEADDRCGGHAHTVEVTLDGVRHGVDTGFLVYNERTYPELIRLFAELDVEVARSEMSFSVQAGGLEWSGSSLDTVFAQRRNLLRPSFWRMLSEVLRFNRLATRLARGAVPEGMTIADFLVEHRFGKEFRDGYFLPMIGCIWSCPTAQMLQFPVATMLRFCDNHGLLQVTRRPAWFTVRGGSRRYVDRLVAQLPDVRLSTPVLQVHRDAAGVSLQTSRGRERFDEVVLACHSDQALAMLADPSPGERELLGAIGYQPNRAVLHTDAALLPRSRRAWAAWNYERASVADAASNPVCLHYLLNRLQPLPWTRPVIVSLNPCREPAPRSVLAEFAYAHPVFDQAAIEAQRRLPAIQGRDGLWFCGAWTRYGFHEDGLASGLAVAQALAERLSARPEKAAA